MGPTFFWREGFDAIFFDLLPRPVLGWRHGRILLDTIGQPDYMGTANLGSHFPDLYV